MNNTFFVVAVKDELTGSFLQPTFGETIAELERIFKYQINNIDLWRSNASDYTLYKLGTYNQETGELFPMIERLVNGRSLLEQKKEEKNK